MVRSLLKISQSSESVSNRIASSPDFATGLDARREFGSTPAGGDVGAIRASCGLRRLSSWPTGRTRLWARLSVTICAGFVGEQAGAGKTSR